MAKKKTTPKPSDTPEIGLPADNAPPTQEPENVVTPPTPAAVQIEAPLGEIGIGYLTRHVEVQLDLLQRQTLRRLAGGLRQSGERLNNGAPVESNASAFRWLLEQLAAANGREDPGPGLCVAPVS